MIRYNILVEGRVQGVGFRYFAQTTGNSYGLTGYAKNLENGMVELEVQGSKERIDLFINTIQKGNHFITVTNLYKKELPVNENERAFRILN